MKNKNEKSTGKEKGKFLLVSYLNKKSIPLVVAMRSKRLIEGYTICNKKIECNLFSTFFQNIPKKDLKIKIYKYPSFSTYAMILYNHGPKTRVFRNWTQKPNFNWKFPNSG